VSSVEANPLTDCNQLDLIFDVLGTPAEEDYYEYASKRTRDYIRSLPLKQKKPWRTIFPNTSELALDLLEKLLAFSPKKRITVEDALKHKYLEEYHATEDEQTARPISDGFFHFDDETKKQLTGEQLKQLLYNEIMQGSN
jgi:mitogen-activated protein kinase 1/3